MALGARTADLVDGRRARRTRAGRGLAVRPGRSVRLTRSSEHQLFGVTPTIRRHFAAVAVLLVSWRSRRPWRLRGAQHRSIPSSPFEANDMLTTASAGSQARRTIAAAVAGLHYRGRRRARPRHRRQHRDLQRRQHTARYSRLPYRDPDRLAIVWEHNIPRDRQEQRRLARQLSFTGAT